MLQSLFHRILPGSSLPRAHRVHSCMSKNAWILSLSSVGLANRTVSPLSRMAETKYCLAGILHCSRRAFSMLLKKAFKSASEPTLYHEQADSQPPHSQTKHKLTTGRDEVSLGCSW